MENGRTFETIVGVLVLIVAGLFFHYVYKKSNWNNINGYTLCAKFDRVDGLSEGGDVRISGVKIGKIVDISVDPESFLAEIKFQIPHSIKMPKDSSANIANDGLLGGKYLSLTPGGEEDCLMDGDEIENTTGAISIESLIGKFLIPGKSGEEKSASESNDGETISFPPIENSVDGAAAAGSDVGNSSTDTGTEGKNQNSPREFSVEFIDPEGKSKEKVVIEENNSGDETHEVRFVVGPELIQAIQDEKAAEALTETAAANENVLRTDSEIDAEMKSEKSEVKENMSAQDIPDTSEKKSDAISNDNIAAPLDSAQSANSNVAE